MDKKMECMGSMIPDTGLGPLHVLATGIKEIIIHINKDTEITQKLNHCYNIVSKLETYLSETATEQSELQLKIYNDHLEEPWEKHRKDGTVDIPYAIFKMISGKLEGSFLRMIAELSRAENILDIGTLTGYSAVTLAESPYCKELVTLDIIPFMEDFVKKRVAGTQVEEKIRIIIAPARDSLQKLKEENKIFDLIFFDADKLSYIDYYKFIMDNGLLAENGVILCDNVLWRSDAYLRKETPEGIALNSFVSYVKNDDRVIQLICPIRDGVLMIKRNINKSTCFTFE